MSLRRRRALFFVLSLVTAGCGGHDGGSPTPIVLRAIPQITIDWPARSRNVSAPASAQSAAIVLQGAGEGGADFAFEVERPEGTAETVQTYTAPGMALRRSALLTVRFHTEHNTNGFVVGLASASVSLAADGQLTRPSGAPLGTLGFVGEVDHVDIPEGQSVDVGMSAELAVSVTNKQGSILTLSPGSFSLAVTQGSDVLQADSGPAVTGVGEGTARVVASVDGKSSLPIVVVVNGPAIIPRSVNLVTSALRYDAMRGKIWASLPLAGGLGNSVVDIDPATGNLGTMIPVGGRPDSLGLSDDGSTLYVGLDDEHAFRRVDLTTRSAGLKVGIPDYFGTPLQPIDIAVQPGNPSTVAITTGTGFLFGNGGPTIYDNGVRRANVLSGYQGSQIVWTAANRLVAFDGSTTASSVFDLAVDQDGVSVARKVDGALDSFSRDIVFDGSRLYGSDGTVLNSTTLSKVGRFVHDVPSNYYESTFNGPVIDAAANRAYFIQYDTTGARLRSYRLDTFAPVANRPLLGVTSSGTSFTLGDVSPLKWGAHGLAFRTQDYVYFIDDLSGL